MMVEAEYTRAKEFGTAHRDDEHVRRARSIVGEDFSSASALGMLRLREHPLSSSNFRIVECCSVLREIFAG